MMVFMTFTLSQIITVVYLNFVTINVSASNAFKTISLKIYKAVAVLRSFNVVVLYMYKKEAFSKIVS